jgi:DNA repair exonuclease SbcCD nuclease subunit
MPRYLFVGDPHVTPDDLNDAKALAFLIKETLVNHKLEEHIDAVVLAGDLYHTHAIIHAEVQFFWWAFFESLRGKTTDVIVLKGNHDAPGVEGSLATALIAHVEQATVVAWRPVVRDGILFCPYTHGDQLVKWSEEHPECNTLICHQTFDGSVYENGFFAGDGVNPNLIKQKRIISGHIHTPQEFFKVWYPGAPRWRTLGDANVERALWILDFDDKGNLMNKTPVDTGSVCRRILQEQDTPAHPLDVNARPAAKDVLHVEIRGPQAWLDERRPLFEGWARVRGVRTDGKVEVKVRESEGVGVAFEKYTDVFQPRHGTERTVLKQMAKERLRGF